MPHGNLAPGLRGLCAGTLPVCQLPWSPDPHCPYSTEHWTPEGLQITRRRQSYRVHGLRPQTLKGPVSELGGKSTEHFPNLIESKAFFLGASAKCISGRALLV